MAQKLKGSCCEGGGIYGGDRKLMRWTWLKPITYVCETVKNERKIKKNVVEPQKVIMQKYEMKEAK